MRVLIWWIRKRKRQLVGFSMVEMSSRNAYAAILTFGVVSLLGDMVYEGGRSLAPEYLRYLGATATLVGIVTGGGEFVGYAFRLLSGALADKTKAYWFFIFLGYGLIAAIPALGVARGVELALILILLERLGRAVRAPSRDTVLSLISKDVGAGKAFGIHELLDQTGAVLGPAIVSGLMFYYSNNYSYAFSALVIPYSMLLLSLFLAFRNVGSRVQAEKASASTTGTLGRGFYTYGAAIALNTIGLVPVSLILFNASTVLKPTEQWIIPLLYLVVQLVDAPMALISGLAYDRIGVKILALPFAVSLLPALLMRSGGLTETVLACIAFGVVLGMQESVYRAAVTNFAPTNVRGTAYGIFNTTLGLGMIVGGLVFGFFLDWRISQINLLIYVAITQFSAILLLMRSSRQRGK